MNGLWTSYNILPSINGYKTKLPNELQIFLIPRYNYKEVLVSLVVNYGSIHTKFSNSTISGFFETPHGMAHFVEHSLFDKSNGTSIHNTFPKYGAFVNGFTSQTQTCLVASFSNQTDILLRLFYDFWRSPSFNEDTLKKNKAIISHEINMYVDDFLWTGYRLSLENAYMNSPVGVDVTGTVESVNRITLDDINLCYSTFYSPKNISMVIVGNFEPYEYFQKISSLYGQIENEPCSDFSVYMPPDTEEPRNKIICIEIDSMSTYITCFYKDTNFDRFSNSSYENEVVLILLDILFSDFSYNRVRLQKINLSRPKFNYSVNYHDSYGYFFIQTQCNNYNLFIEEYKNCWFETFEMTDAKFKIAVRKRLGSYITKCDNLTTLSSELRKTVNRNITISEIFDFLNNLDYLTIFEKYKEILSNFDKYFIYVVLKGKNK